MKTYEDMFRDVEKIIEQLNQPSLDLEKTIQRVQEGMALIDTLKKNLAEASMKVEELKGPA